VKRTRDEESEASAVAQQLEAAAQEGSDDSRKLKALSAVTAAIDSSDEQYEAQKVLVGGGALAVLAELLSDESAAVSVAAADALLHLTQHSPAAIDRLLLGGNFTMGNPESVSFNPVQSDVLDHGIIPTLVKLQFEGSEEQQDAAFAALAALGAYNRGNKLSQLHELVRRLIDGQSKAAPLVEAVLDSMDFKDDVAVVLDQALGTILGTLSSGSSQEQQAAASLLGVVLAKRPSIADFLVAEGALENVVSLLLTGDAETADVAVAAVWGLVKGNQRLLRAGSTDLGVAGTELVPPLLNILQRTQDDVPDVDGETEEDEEGGGSDNGEAAAALLRALARADPTVMSLLKEDKDAPAAATVAPSRCAIM